MVLSSQFCDERQYLYSVDIGAQDDLLYKVIPSISSNESCLLEKALILLHDLKMKKTRRKMLISRVPLNLRIVRAESRNTACLIHD